MLNFDEKNLVTDLQRLPPELRVAFAAACAERQMSACRAFMAKQCYASRLRLVQALEDTWAHQKGRSQESLEQQLNECIASIPQQAAVRSWTQDANYAQFAGISVAYTLRAELSGAAQEAAWSARQAWESLYQVVIDREHLDINRPEDMKHVLSHPLLQAELSRQRRDLDELLNTSDDEIQVKRTLLRDRAKRESQIFFGITPTS